MERRNFIGALMLGLLSASTGCLDVLTGTEPVTVEAEAAIVSERVASEAGYQLTDTSSPTVARDIKAGGQARTVEATNRVATYEKAMSIPSIDEENLATFSAIATPSVKVFGRTLSPIGDYSYEELIDLLSSEYGELNTVDYVESQETTVLGVETDVSKYAARAMIDGQDIDVSIHVTRVENESDYVILIGIYPEKKSDEEQDIISMIEGVNHPTKFS